MVDANMKLGWKRRARRLLSRQLRPVESWARKRLLLAIDQAVLLTRATPQPNTVLLVRLDNIGDFVVWLDAAMALTTHYRAQGKRVTLLANAVWKRWADELELFDEVLELEEKRFRRDIGYRFRMACAIRARGFETAVQPAFTRLLEGGDAVIRMSGARHRIGPVGTFEFGLAGDRLTADRWFTELLPTEAEDDSEMGRNAAFVRAVTGGAYRARVADLRKCMNLHLPQELRAEIWEKQYFVLFPGATFGGRLWPAERYVELADRIVAATGLQGVVCGGPSEAAQALRICEEAAFPLWNWVGRTSLPGLAAVLANAELLVGNETSAVHIAAAVGTPTVCITGGGHFGRFMPYRVDVRDGRPLPVAATHRMECFGCDWRCVYHPPKGSPVPCIEQVSVEEAWAAVRGLLRPKRPRTHEPLTVLQCLS